MYKTLFVSLTLATACATSEKPVAHERRPMSTNGKPAPTENRGASPSQGAVAVSKDGTKIAFEKVGSGPSLVIVGGALSHRDGGKPMAGKLMDRFSVYTYDRRGRGESSDTKPYAVDREIEDLDALIQKAGNRAYLFGVSSGAALALQAAAKLGPSKVPKLAVYDVPYGQGGRVFNEQKEGVRRLVRDGEPGDAAAFFLTAIGTPPPVLEDMKKSPEWEVMRKIDYTLEYDYAVLGTGAVPDTVQLIAVPTLVMTGEKSLDFMQPAADRIAKLIPSGQRQTLKGQAHQAKPDVVGPLLIDFFGEGA